MSFVDTLGKYGKACGVTHHLFAPIICTDGTFLSIQCGYGYHSTPDKSDLPLSEYETFEVRTDVEDDDDFALYGDGDSLFSYVPTEVIDSLIEKHGGIDEDAIKQYIAREDAL